ncbi:MXAN_6640 family putative metalloprotease [Nocardioides sp. C4-1]|uniref:MXAN_6640 family putative metalloprotease n=1 Tax=Nocardioides sp. C4-1 TaxID=3151851 RepID=UPI00326596F6
MLTTLPLALLLAGTVLPGPAASSATASGPDDVLAPSERRAIAATERAEVVAEGIGDPDSAAGGGTSTERADVTMALREVANTREVLSGDEREAADALLRRPTDGAGDGLLAYDVVEATPVCTEHLCVHYVATTDDAPAMTDGNGDGVPDYVQTTLDTLTRVADDYVAAGYRRPKPDGARGGDARTDVYLGDLGPGIYGYCSSDDPSTSNSRGDRWAYCVLDNDYDPTDFPSNTPLENLRVTIAHEYFHAVQFAYDRYEDAWLLEATAAWVEDEMFDDVDDNLQYLRNSPMTQPKVSLDKFGNGGFHYGTWSFFRYLTERFRARQGRLPTLVRDVWRLADSAPGGPDLYSWQAVEKALAARGVTGKRMLAGFAAANRRPARAYRDGAVNRYPTAPVAAWRTLSPGARGQAYVKMKHLTTATVVLRKDGLRPSSRVKLTFDMGARATSPVALTTTYFTDGTTSTTRVSLGPAGKGTRWIPVGQARIQRVEVTLTNGSARFRCFQGTTFSCGGRPLDNAVRNGFGLQVLG